MNNWVPLREVEFNENIERISVDTRDFACLVSNERDKDYSWLREGRLFTLDKVESILFKLMAESGGDVKWRMLSFENDHTDKSGWDWKYIRIYKTPKGYAIGTARKEDVTFVTKSFFDTHKVNQIHLHAH